MKFSEDALRKQISDVRKDLSLKESYFNPFNGSGFGGGVDDERQLNYEIQSIRDRENRLVQELNNSLLRKSNRSSNIAAWLSAIAAVTSAATSIILLFHKS